MERLLSLMETPGPLLSPPARTLPSLPPTPAGSSHCPAHSPHPPFRARAESAWVNLAAGSPGAGASPRLSLRVLPGPALHSASARPPPPPPAPPTPTLAQRSDHQSRSPTAYGFGLQLSPYHCPRAPGETVQDGDRAGALSWLPGLGLLEPEGGPL